MTEYAALFLAYLITGFVIWITLEAKESFERVLFAARDVFLLMDIYLYSFIVPVNSNHGYVFYENSNLVLEAFLTSIESSFWEVSGNGKLIFQDEFRTYIQLEMLRD